MLCLVSHWLGHLVRVLFGVAIQRVCASLNNALWRKPFDHVLLLLPAGEVFDSILMFDNQMTIYFLFFVIDLLSKSFVFNLTPCPRLKINSFVHSEVSKIPEEDHELVS